MSASVLDPYVVSLTAYDVDMSAPGIHRGLPSTTSTLVFPVGEALDVSWAADPGSRRKSWSSVAGLHTSHAQIHHGRWQQGVQLELTPAGVRALLGMPVAALAGQLLDLDDLAGEAFPGLANLPEELAATRRAHERERLVARRLVVALAASGAPGPRAEVGHALARLAQGTPVQTVADETGYSRRHLRTLVRAECGVGPKDFQRLARFQASRGRWAGCLATGRGTLADVAAETGYADQAHLTREWVELAGCTPTTWAREEFPFVQDPGVPDGAT